MKSHKNQIGRREALWRLVASGSAAAALPAFSNGSQEKNSKQVVRDRPRSTALGSALPPDPALSSENWEPVFFDSHQNQTVIVLSDLIIPDTDTPGATTAHVNRFIDLLLASGPAKERENYIEALGWLDGYCLSRYSHPFIGLDHNEQCEVLTLLTHPSGIPKIGHGISFFSVLKSSIVQAYYTSEIGMLEELKYQTNPFQMGCPGCGCKPTFPS
jgi:Gluconate 2-dehydrogenase subunit 3